MSLIEILLAILLVETIALMPVITVFIVLLFSRKDIIFKKVMDVVIPQFTKKLSSVINKKVKENVDEYFSKNRRVEVESDNMDFLNS